MHFTPCDQQTHYQGRREWTLRRERVRSQGRDPGSGGDTGSGPLATCPVATPHRPHDVTERRGCASAPWSSFPVVIRAQTEGSGPLAPRTPPISARQLTVVRRSTRPVPSWQAYHGVRRSFSSRVRARPELEDVRHGIGRDARACGGKGGPMPPRLTHGGTGSAAPGLREVCTKIPGYPGWSPRTAGCILFPEAPLAPGRAGWFARSADP